MPFHIKSILPAISATAIFGLLAANIAAQSTGPAAFAARQNIKNQVLAAMSDGKITPDERRDILSPAKDILSAKEYVGLVNTMNRLSPPDKSVPVDIGYNPADDKQMMANFPAPDLPLFNNSKLGEKILPQSIAKELMPAQTNVAKATAPKQTYIVKEIITKQTVVTAASPNRTVAKASTSKQSVAKKTTSKQTVVKAETPKQAVIKADATKQSAAKAVKSTAPAKTPDVVVIPPPPSLQEDNIQPRPSMVGKVQKPSKPADPSAPLPSAEQYQTRNSSEVKPVPQIISENLKKQPPAANRVTIRQPANLLNMAEKSASAHFYADYSVPVLATPAAALLNDRSSNTIQASYDETLEPESGQSIIRR